MLLKELYVVPVVILLLGLKQIYWRCFCSGSGRFGQRPRAGSGRLVVVMRLTNFQSIPPIGSGLLGLVVRFTNFPSIPTWLRPRLIPILLHVPPFTVIYRNSKRLHKAAASVGCCPSILWIGDFWMNSTEHPLNFCRPFPRTYHTAAVPCVSGWLWSSSI